MNDMEKEYLSDTISILVNYDGETTIEGLKALIDETRERLTKIYSGEVKKPDLGIAFDIEQPFEVLEGGKSILGNSEENQAKSEVIKRLDKNK